MYHKLYADAQSNVLQISIMPICDHMEQNLELDQALSQVSGRAWLARLPHGVQNILICHLAVVVRALTKNCALKNCSTDGCMFFLFVCFYKQRAQ